MNQNVRTSGGKMMLGNTVRLLTIAICMALLMPAALSAQQQSKPYTPKPGSRERKAILDALRKPVMRSNNGKRVIFTKVDLKVYKGWAYVFGASVDTKGKPVSPYPQLTYWVSAFLRNTNGKWRVMEWAYATDVISI